MRFGIHVVDFDGISPSAIGPTLLELSRLVDQSGACELTTMDHFFHMETAGVDKPLLEGYTTLAYFAAATTSVRLGLLVTGVTYRHPAVLAKTIATLDVLSGGRAQLGLGAGWYEREHVGLGIPFPSVPERYAMLEDTIRLCKQMWSADDGPFSGAVWHANETICSPRPLSQPHPRVTVGGGGEQTTLRLVARHADACNFVATSVEEVAHKLGVLDRHCGTEGRDPASVERTLLYTRDPFDDLDGFQFSMEAYAALGVAQVSLMAGSNPIPFLERASAELLPRMIGL